MEGKILVLGIIHITCNKVILVANSCLIVNLLLRTAVKNQVKFPAATLRESLKLTSLDVQTEY